MATIAIEPSGLTSNVGDCWDLDASVYTYDYLAICRLFIWERCGCIGYPLLIFPLDP